ncbi:MAG: hypothetical protein PVI40_08645 [Chlamydiota bacterium]|jgi:hypothetical protein
MSIMLQATRASFLNSASSFQRAIRPLHSLSRLHVTSSSPALTRIWAQNIKPRYLPTKKGEFYITSLQSHQPTTELHIGLFNIINQMKSVALSANQRIKDLHPEANVRIHQVVAAVMLATQKYFTEGGDLAMLFGPLKEEAQADLFSWLDRTCKNIQSAKDDRMLNAALFGLPGCENNDRFFPIEELEEKQVSFHGRIEVWPSFGRKIEIGRLVNVILHLDNDSAKAVTISASHAIYNSPNLSGAAIGRLTSTADLMERHISLALRIPYTEKLQSYVDRLNAENEKHDSSNLTGKTSGKIHILVPPDIRAQISAVSMLAQETIDRFQPIQNAITIAAGKKGNRLPRLHITQANIPVKQNMKKLDEWIERTTLQNYLNPYLSMKRSSL